MKKSALKVELESWGLKPEEVKTNLKADLKPCPFCGEDEAIHLIHTHTPYWWVKCEMCDATSDSAYGQKRAAAKWNRRKS